MGASVPPDVDALIAQRRKALTAPSSDLDAVIAERRKALQVEQPGVVSRAASQIGGAMKQTLAHPLDTIGSLVSAPVTSAMHAILSPEEGDARPNPSLSKGGNSAHVTGAELAQPYDKEHGAIPKGERAAGGVQTAANIAFPGVASGVAGKLGGGALAKLAGLATAGAGAGAAYSPKDPAAGALAGAVLAPAVHGVGKAVGSAAESVAGKALDVAGRPAETRTMTAGPISVAVEGLGDRATRLNRAALGRSPSGVDPTVETNGKPLTPVDLTGTAGVRAARGLKTSSPAAEQVFRDAFSERQGDAVDRVIAQAKELTGIKRANAYDTHEQLKATTAAEGNAAYGKVWSAEKGKTVQHEDLASVLNRPAVKHALPAGMEIMANEGIETPTPGLPPGFSADQWKQVQQAAKAQGLALPGAEFEPTLQHLHYAKLAMDDMKRGGMQRGTGAGGVRYNEARAIGTAQGELLKIMDAHSPDYAAARSQFADNKSIENASELGQDHWTRDPAESAALLKEMTPGEQKIYKDQAFDRWAENKVENGPENVGKSTAKPRDQKRARLLFPDDASFEQFKQGLQHEAEMHANTQGVLGGSNTADKLSDMASMVGLTVPDVVKAMKGNPLPLAGKVGSALVRKAGLQQADNIAELRAKQLSAGANGDPVARRAALEALAAKPTRRPALLPVPSSGATSARDKQ